MLSKVCTYTYPLAGSALCRSRCSRSCKCLYPLLQAPFVPTLRLHCREKVSFGCAHALASKHWYTCIGENASLYERQIHKIGGTAIGETERENIKREKRKEEKEKCKNIEEEWKEKKVKSRGSGTSIAKEQRAQLMRSREPEKLSWQMERIRLQKWH